MRVLSRLWLLLVALVALPALAQAAPPVSIKIQVIEASTKSKTWDPKLRDLKKAIKGYSGAQVVDELSTKVDPGASVSLQIMERSRLLKVTLREVLPDGTVKLSVAIDAFKFSTNTTHKKGRATVIVAHETSETTAVFLAVTPEI